MTAPIMTAALCFLFPFLCGVCAVAAIRLIELFREEWL
jgi:hypothetical protein